MSLRRMLSPLALAACVGLPGIAGAGAPGGRALMDLAVVDSRTIEERTVDGWAVKELSGLAWDEDEQILYAVSDKGRIVHIRLRMDGDRIGELEPVRAFPLADETGAKLSKRDANAEGVSTINSGNGVKGDTELIIVTENGPEIARFTPEGRRIARYDVPSPLADVGQYSKPDSGLESVALHPALGVVTAPARPLRSQAADTHRIFTSSGATLALAPHDVGAGKVKAIDVLTDGRLMVLERMPRGADGLRYSALRLVDPGTCAGQGPCRTIELDASQAALPDANFEGLTRLSSDLWAAVSDDLAGEQRRCLFVVFRLTLQPGRD